MNGQQNQRIALNTTEAAKYLSINRTLLDSLRKAGTIKSLKVGRLYLYPVSILDSFINDNIGKEITKDGIVIGE